MSDRAGVIGARLALFYGAFFAAVGVHLPFWPVWLASRGLDAAEIGYVLAAAFWPRVVTNLLIPQAADRLGERRRLMVLLAALTLGGLVLFGLVRGFWGLMLLSLVTGASWAAVLPLGEALSLQTMRTHGLDYGRVRLWGSITFIAAAVGAGRWLEWSGPPLVLHLLLGTVGMTLAACLLLPETRAPDRPAQAPDLRRLLRQPGFLWFVLAAGLIQVSHAVYYGFATLHWQAAGLGEAVIGWLWAEGVIAEVLLFAFAAALLRRLEPLHLLAFAGGLTVVRWGVTAIGTDLVLLIPAQALHGASFGAVHLAAMHHLRDRTPPELHASAQGAYAALGSALLFGIVTPVAGWLYGSIGGGAFWAMAALALAGTILAAALNRRGG